MKFKYSFIISIYLLTVILVGCENTGEKSKHPVIEESTVSISSVQNSEKEVLHFDVLIEDYGLGPEQEFRAQIIIKEPYVSELINTELIEIPDTWRTFPKGAGGVLSISIGQFREIDEAYSLEELRNYIENEEAVIVEVYNDNEIISKSNITTFKDKRGE